MRHKALHYIFSGLAILLASSCVNENFDSNPMLIQLKSGISSYAAGTKAIEKYDYDTDKALDISVIRWDEGEPTTFAGKSFLSATMGRPDPMNEWKRTIEFNDHQYFKDTYSKVGFRGFHPEVQGNPLWQVNNDGSMAYTIDGETDVMVSEGESGNYANGIPVLPFCHGLCHFRIYAYAVDNDSKEYWGDITQVQLLNLPEKLQIAFQPDEVGNGIPVFTYTDHEGGALTKELLEKGETISLTTSSDTKVLLGETLAGAPIKGMLSVAVASEKYQGEEGKPLGNSASIARNFKPGFTYNIILRFSEHGKINAECTVESWQFDGNDYEKEEHTALYTDLSYNGTANCYIVSTANIGYCFNASVKGNAVNSFTDNYGKVYYLPDTDINLDIDSVRIAGQYGTLQLDPSTGKYNTVPAKEQIKAPMISLESKYITNGYVRFKAIGLPNQTDYRLPYKGNARINAYKNGKVVWSWHIWLTDKPMDIIYRNGYISMDRNLGALSNNPADFNDETNTTNGICYQFGRKDPMFRYLIENNKKDYVVNKEVTVAEAHANPRVYYYNDKNDWTSDQSDHFWGFANEREGAHKTMYDPCPPGYKVPVRAMFDYVVADAQEVKATPKKGEIDTGFTIRTSIDTVYYPHSFLLARGGHVRDNDDFTQEDTLLYINSTYLYTATPVVNTERAYHFSFDIDEFNSSANYNAIQQKESRGGRRANAYPVRCVKEGSGLASTNLSKYQSANSYIISDIGYYSFNASVRGNGVVGLNLLSTGEFVGFDDGLGSTFSDKLDHVDILWWQGELSDGSSYRTFIDNKDYSEENVEAHCPVLLVDHGNVNSKNQVMFYVQNTTPANVGLAAYDNNNRIIWTWHIWINPNIKVLKFGEYGIMNAQLGATYIPENLSQVQINNYKSTLGFYYQWGRKDPMFQNGEPYMVKDINGTWHVETSLNSEGLKSISYTIENPLKFFTSDINTWQTSYPGKDPKDEALWGYAGASGSEGNSFIKTMWDPCPPGYKVIDHTLFKSANICYSDEAIEDFTLSNTASNSYGLWLTTNSKSDYSSSNADVDLKGIFFPFGGYIESTTGNNSETTWNYTSTSCPMGFGKEEEKPDPTFRFLHIAGNMIGNGNSQPQGTGMSVRCLKE